MAPSHLSAIFEQTCAEHAGRSATRIKADDGWQIATFGEFHRDVLTLSRALIAAGVQPGDRVGIFAGNSPQWSQVFWACCRIRAVVVPVYATSTVDQTTHIAADSGLRVLFTGDAEKTQVASAAAENLPELQRIIAFQQVDKDVATLADFVQVDPRPELDDELQQRLLTVDPEDLAAIVYTSGTTGDPRGVMLSHRAMLAQFRSLDEFFDLQPDDHSLCFLPLAHSLEMGWSSYIFTKGCMNTYVTDTRKVSEILAEAMPNLLVSVPKLYEMVYSVARGKVASSKLKSSIFDWALRVGGQMQKAHSKGREPRLWWRLQRPIADRLVFRNVRDAMGGPKKVLACGGAPLRIEIEHFFSACGMQILTGYGLTEAAPLVSFNRHTAYKQGTAGIVMPGGELAIGLDSEVFYRGPNLMSGYWNQPEATAEAIDEDGWLHTGDVGFVDADGFLTITDRLKDIIVTIGGKNVAPQPIEAMVLADPLFEQAILLGDNRPYLTLLLKPALPMIDELAERFQVVAETVEEKAANAQVIEEIKNRVAALTEKLPRQEKIRDIRVIFDEFSIDNGLLTPSLKVRRKAVEEKFSALIEDMYTKLAELRKSE